MKLRAHFNLSILVEAKSLSDFYSNFGYWLENGLRSLSSEYNDIPKVDTAHVTELYEVVPKEVPAHTDVDAPPVEDTYITEAGIELQVPSPAMINHY